MTVSNTTTSQTLNQINQEIARTTAKIQEIDLKQVNPNVSARQKLAHKARRKVLVKILKRLKKMAQQYKKGKEVAPGALKQASQRVDEYSLNQPTPRRVAIESFAL